MTLPCASMVYMTTDSTRKRTRYKYTVQEAVWDKITVTGFCWLWEGYVDAHGYGYAAYQGKNHRAHRHVYELLVGEIPKGLVLDHLCRVRNCVNPDHLEPVTHKENLMRGYTHARANSEKTHCAQGHEYTPENTYREKLQRVCKTCKIIRQRARNDNDESRDKRAAYERARRARKRLEALNEQHAVSKSSD